MDMEYKIFVTNPFQENTVVLYDHTGRAAVIDCGCFDAGEEKRVRDFLVRENLTPELLLNTHLHPDHVFGNHFMKACYGLQTKAAEADLFLLEHAVDYAAMLGIREMTAPPSVGEYLKDGDEVRWGESELEVIAVGGHTPGGLCFYSERDRLLVAGDVLFAGSIGRSDLPGGDGERLIREIREKLMGLPDEVKVIPGHGPVTTIGEERAFNPFLNE